MPDRDLDPAHRGQPGARPRQNRRASFWKRLVGLDDGEADGAEPRQFPAPAPSAERTLLAREELEAVWNALSSLSPQQRAIFFLRYEEEMPLAQIADLLQLKIGSVKTQLSRATGKVARDEGETMEIIRHLSTDELMDLTIESDRRSLRPTLESLPDWARASTEHSEEFWQKQREPVWSRISTPRVPGDAIDWPAGPRRWHGRPWRQLFCWPD